MKQSRLIQTYLIIAAVKLFLIGCGEVKTPSRDQIPIIKESFSKLQQGIYDRNLAAIDSLLHVDILKKKLTSDSLLRIVYGPNYDLPFKSFAQPEIVYTDEFARIESALMDSTAEIGRPVTFTFSYDSGRWLLIEFTTGHLSKSNQ